MAWLKRRLRHLRRHLIYPVLGVSRLDRKTQAHAISRIADRQSKVARRQALSEIRRNVSAGAVAVPLKMLQDLGSIKDKRTTELHQRLSEIHTILDRGPQEVFSFAPPSTEARKPTGRIQKSLVLMTFNGSFPWQTSGYAVRNHMIIRHLRESEFDVFASTRPGFPWDLNAFQHVPDLGSEEFDGITYRRLTGNSNIRKGLAPDSAYVWHYARALQQIASSLSPMAIHAAANYYNGLAAIRAGRTLAIPSVYELRGLWHYSRSVKKLGFEESEHFAYEDAMERFAAASADYVVVISTALRDHVISEWGINSKKIWVIPNAVDINVFVPTERDHSVLRDLRLEDYFVVGFIGSLTAYEGLDDLIKAISMLDGQPPVGLVIVGDGPVLADLQALARELGCADRVRFTGQVEFSDVKRYYSCFDLCAYPRRDLPVCRHVPPLKPLEAMAMGIPVIVSDLPPLLELVDNGKAGFTCTPGAPESLADAIRKIRDNPEDRSRIARAGYDWARTQHAWHSVVGGYCEIYEEIRAHSNQQAQSGGKRHQVSPP